MIMVSHQHVAVDLRDWLEADIAEVEHRWVLEAQERLHGITSGERTTIDVVQVLAEARRIAGH